MKLNILGQDYELLLLTEDEYPKLGHNDANGLAELHSKKLIISQEGATETESTYDNLRDYTDKVVRHEIVHAFFHEAGLNNYCSDEVLVDWLSYQLPKMFKVIQDFESQKKDFYKKIEMGG